MRASPVPASQPNRQVSVGVRTGLPFEHAGTLPRDQAQDERMSRCLSRVVLVCPRYVASVGGFRQDPIAAGSLVLVRLVRQSTHRRACKKSLTLENEPDGRICADGRSLWPRRKPSTFSRYERTWYGGHSALLSLSRPSWACATPGRRLGLSGPPSRDTLHGDLPSLIDLGWGVDSTVWSCSCQVQGCDTRDGDFFRQRFARD